MCRCAKYYEQGARFAKWRAVLKIGNGCPSGEPDAVLRLRACCAVAIAMQQRRVDLPI